VIAIAATTMCRRALPRLRSRRRGHVAGGCRQLRACVLPEPCGRQCGPRPGIRPSDQGAAVAPRHVAASRWRLVPGICYRCHGDMKQYQEIAGPHQICGPNGSNCTTCHDAPRQAPGGVARGVVPAMPHGRADHGLAFGDFMPITGASAPIATIRIREPACRSLSISITTKWNGRSV